MTDEKMADVLLSTECPQTVPMRHKDVERYIEVPVPGKLQVPAYQL